MTKNKRNWIMIGGLALVVFFLLFIAVFWFVGNQRVSDDKLRVQVYFLNPSTNKLEPEYRYIKKGANLDEINELLTLLFEGPKSKNLVKIATENVVWIDGQLIDNKSVLELEFSDAYNDLSLTEELFFRGSLVWTMTELGYIRDVHIYVNGQELLKGDGNPVGYLNRTNLVINPIISPDKVDIQRVILYFTNGYMMLEEEVRVIQVNPDQPIEKYIVEQLILGSNQPGFIQTIPSETEVRDVKTEGDICYVNLSSSFVTKHTGNENVQLLTIYSIVNSLTELTNVKKVQFFIESEKIESFKGTFDFSKPIERDESLIMKE